MQYSELASLLAAGGVAAAPVKTTDEASNRRLPKYNGMLDPAGADTLGRELAEVLVAYRPTTVLIWEDPTDLILAHVTSRELSATVVQAFDADGLVGFIGTFPPESKVVLLADVFREYRIVKALALLVEQQGGTVVATAELFTVFGESLAHLPGVPSVVLAQLDPTSPDDPGDRAGTEAVK